MTISPDYKTEYKELSVNKRSARAAVVDIRISGKT